ncbi:MAG: tetratricopeptide repeat protein [Gammaproteobacteria bacterium]|nr:tetratricopeptide repeat protein [Gammaproteobacteria bacterium]
MLRRLPPYVFGTALLLALLVMLSACAGIPSIEQDPTIALLAERAARIEPQALPPLSRADVQRTYRQLAQTTTNDALKAIALQRLADLALEDRQAVLAGEAQTDKVATPVTLAPPSTAAVTETLTEPVAESATPADIEADAEQATIQSAIHQYERLLTLYPDYAGNDRVMYQLARGYELNGDLEKTLDVLTRLVAQYPEQANQDEIQFRRGEILFSFRDFEAAEQAYAQVLSMSETGPYYERSMFKHGWSVFKQGATERSLKSYFAVLDRSFAGGREIADFSRSERELLDDTLRIVSLSFSYLQGHESVTAFFEDYGRRDYEFHIYARLADLYRSQQRNIDASDTFMAFVQRYPQHGQAPLFLVRVIDIYKQAGQKEALLRAKADLVMGYGVGTAFWKRHDADLLAQMLPHLKANLDDLTRYYHAQAQTSRAPADYRIAAHWYRTYVRAFPDDAETPAKHMLLAESLLDSGEVQAAAVEFEYTAYHYPLFGQSAEAGYAAILAHRQQVEALQGSAANAKRETLIASSKRFVSTFPADPRAVKVMSKAAEELLVLKDYRNAVATAHHVVGHRPAAERALLQINWAIIAQGEFELGLYPQAEQASLKRLQYAAADDRDRQDHEERLAAAIYKQGESARAAGDQREAARHFLRVGQLTPRAGIRANADFDAAAALFANADWALAIPVLKAFVQNFPTHQLRAGADEKLALAYEKSGDWQHAAAAYEVLYRNETDANKKRLLLWQTAEFYEKAQQQDQAIEVYKRYVAAFPAPFDDAIEARFRLASMYQQKGQVQPRHYWLAQLIAAHKAGPATDRSHYLAATAELELAEPMFENYRKVHLVQPLQQNLKKKKDLMQETIQAFTAAADYGVEAVTTASTFRIAEIYNDFGRNLVASERPAGLSAEELEQYDILLEEQAYPFEEKAIEVHALNAARTIDDVYDEWVKKSFSALEKLSPIRYAKNEKSEPVNHAIE